MTIARSAAVAMAMVFLATGTAAQTVFINEIHYDNASTDVGEAIEVAGPAGTDLSGWSIVLYNGNGGAVYGTISLPGTITAQCGGFGTVSVTASGLQNGAPDGFALVNASSTVVQFLSYEGSFTAVGGAANGMTSTDIGVSEVGTEAAGNSLQLKGSGKVYGDFTWSAPSDDSFGTCNAGQTFGVELTIDDVALAEGNSGATVFAFTVSLSEPAPVGGVTFDIATQDNTATTADADYDANILTSQVIPATQSSYTFSVNVNGDTVFEPTQTFFVNVSNVVGTDVFVGDGQGLGTITNDDAITLSIDDVSHAEGDAGTIVFTFTVSLSEPAPTGGVTFDIGTTDGSATTADGDYVTHTETGEIIPEAQSSYTFDVTVNGDITFEPDETFTVSVTNVVGTNVFTADGDGTGTIANDDTEPLVINEIDYDQAGTDTAEFVEIYNTGTVAIDLNPFSLVGVNGSGGGAAVYRTVDLPAVSLAAGDYFVVCTNAATVPFCDLDASPDTDLFQNGAPDAVALVNGARVVDTVSYEGDTAAPYTETSGTGLEDGGSGYTGISRYPDGTDTDVNNVDLSLRCTTPGKANSSASSSCPNPGAFLAVVINEVDSDTPSTDTAEFIELYDGGVGNVPLSDLVVVLFNGGNDLSYAAYDLDGYTTDASGYFVLGNAAVSPDLSFTDNLLQNGADAVALYRGSASSFPTSTPVTTASLQDAIVYDTSDADDTGLLVLLNAGQPQVDENGNAAAATQSSQRCPNGTGGARNTSTYLQTAPTAGSANFCVSGTYEIYEIQGNGMASPFVGVTVATNNNVVTAVGPEGFFIQTPDARADAAAETSNGIYVYTGAAPTVGLGNQVDVTGTVQEYYEFTQIAGAPLVHVDSSGNTLPAAVDLDSGTPSPSQPQPANAYERYEGMRVSIVSGLVSGPSQYFASDMSAEVFVVASGLRPFRETGLLYPGDPAYPSVPVWDGNPEVFELDSDKLVPALDPDLIPAGSTFSAEGVLAYEFSGYEVWPTSLTLNPVTLPVPVRARAAGELTVGSLNTLHLYDDVDDPGSEDDGNVESFDAYHRHLYKLARYVVDVLGAPDIVGVQEVEHLGALQNLADDIGTTFGIAYDAYLEEGNDVGGIDVGFLVRSDTMANEVITQLGKDQRLSVDNSLLHDRPPLQLEADYVGNGAAFPIKVLVLHQRSLNDIETSTRVRQKRLEQAQAVAQMVQDLQNVDPAVHLVVVGDFNAFEVTDGYVDVVGQIKGDFDPSQSMLSGPDLVDPNLHDEVLDLPAGQRYSFVYNGTAQVLDHALTSEGIAPFVRGMEFGRGNADAPEYLEFEDFSARRCSDHDGLVVFVMTDSDGNGYPDDAPQFALFGNANGQASGNVSDASGIASLVLGAGSFNVVLTPSGAAGDTVWGWTVTLANAELSGQAELVATDQDGRTARYIVALQSHPAVPTASPSALALLALLLGLAGALALGRRTLLG